MNLEKELKKIVDQGRIMVIAVLLFLGFILLTGGIIYDIDYFMVIYPIMLTSLIVVAFVSTMERKSSLRFKYLKEQLDELIKEV